MDVRCGLTFLRSPFADKDFWTTPAVAVGMVHIFFERGRRLVEMFIKDIRGSAGHAGSGNHLQFWIGRFYRVIELSEATVVTSLTVEGGFIADLDVLKMKRL